MYQQWGIDDLQPLEGKTVDLMSRLPLGEEDRDQQGSERFFDPGGVFRATDRDFSLTYTPYRLSTVRVYI